MTAYEKQDSNSTASALAVETSFGVIDGSAVWNQQEPNSYKDFGGTYKLVARKPINASRQQRKGVITDLSAAGGWQEDLTYVNMQTFLEGVMFADYRKKAELPVLVVANAASSYEPTSGGGAYVAGDILFAKYFSVAANNGVKNVVSGATSAVDVAEVTADETGSAGVISKVGFKFASGDATFDASGANPKLLTTAKDLTTLGLNPGEWVYIGSDAANTSFATAGNNGFLRVKQVAPHVLTFDKHGFASVGTDAGTGKTIVLYFGRFVKNENDPTLIKRRTYQAERILGKAASDSSYQQAEYLTGSVLDTLLITFNSADKVTYDLSVMGAGYETRDSSVGPKAGTRPQLISGNAFNTSTDLVRASISICGQASPLFARLTDIAVTINNNAAMNKALGTLGAFDITAGEFTVSMAGVAYFATVAALDAVRHNADVTVDAIVARNNVGIALDIPLGALGDTGLKVAANQPITLPITLDAAKADSVDPNYTHTVAWTFFDYLPNVAMGA